MAIPRIKAATIWLVHLATRAFRAVRIASIFDLSRRFG